MAPEAGARYILHLAAVEKLRRAYQDSELLRLAEEAERSIRAGDLGVPLEQVERDIRQAQEDTGETFRPIHAPDGGAR